MAIACDIELFAEEPAADDVAALLGEAGLSFAVRPFQQGAPGNGGRLYVVDAGRRPESALQTCHRLRSEQKDGYTPILFVRGQELERRTSLENGADVSLGRPLDAAEFLAQVQALLRVKERHDRLAVKAAEAQRMSQRLQSATQQMDQELELARRLQESFLPQQLPSVSGVRFAVKYKPAARVGGDFYDCFRLDEKHVGFYVADAMGHGVPASLLTIFVKKGVRAKEIDGQQYRLVPPAEVLQRLNRDLLEQQIPDLPFITMIYALFNCQERTLQFSRAGHPYPLYIPVQGNPVLWQIEGSLLGVFDTHYRLQTHAMNPGDKLILYTDGMDAASFQDQPVGLASLLAAAEEFRALPVGELVERLASDLFAQTRQSDDLTVFGMEMI